MTRLLVNGCKLVSPLGIWLITWLWRVVPGAQLVVAVAVAVRGDY
jgi:hypothetical protein